MTYVTYVIAVLLFVSSVINAKPVVLTEDSWRDMLNGEWMVEFYAPWCPACKALTSVWNDLASWAPNENIQVGQVDITENPGLSGRFMVTALPTIYHVKDGVFRQYQGARDIDSFLNFISQKDWNKIKPISSWKHPDSVQMSTVAQFFRWSYQIRSMHTYLVDQVGIPYWASYGIFALATIVIGALFGLLIVACIDMVVWPKNDFQRIDETSIRDNDSDLAEDSGAQSSPQQTPQTEAKKKRSKKID